jgi:hypothetical protein
MARVTKWTIAVLAAAIAFVVGFWFCWRLGYRVLPGDLSMAERRMASVGFAAVLAAGVGAAVNWWAGHDQTTVEHADQIMTKSRVTAGEGGSRTAGQVGGSVGRTADAGRKPPRQVMSKSRIKGGKRGSTVVGQVGGDFHTGDDDG